MDEIGLSESAWRALGCVEGDAVVVAHGAPKALSAGLALHARLGTRVEPGQPLLTLHAESPGDLAYAMAYAEHQENLFTIVKVA